MHKTWFGFRPLKAVGVCLIILSFNWLILGLGLVYGLQIPIVVWLVQLIIGAFMICKGKSSPNIKKRSNE